MILRSRAKLSNSYHRIMFGMSVTDIILSSALALSSLPAPIGTPDVWKSLGNRSTCKAQGFFIMFGTTASPTYFLSLQIFYFFVIKYQSSRQNVKQKVEPFLHVAPILVGLISAVVPLVTNSFNPGSRGYCWAQDFPLHCSDNQTVDCIRGEMASTQRNFLMILPWLGIMVLVCVMMWKIYAAVRDQDARNASHNFQSSIRRRQSLPNNGPQMGNTSPTSPTSPTHRRASLIMSPEELRAAQYEKSRKARTRILQYFVGYSLTFIFFLLDGFLHRVKSIDNLLEILTMIFYPLVGFFNLIVFVIPAVRKVQQDNTEFCFCRALISAIISYVGPDNGDSRELRQVRRASIATMVSQLQTSTSNIGDCVSDDSSIDHNIIQHNMRSKQSIELSPV